MRKGFTEAATEMIQWIGLIVICFVMLYVVITWASSGAHVQRGIEQGSLMYTIASSTNALSTMEEGEIVRNLNSYYDIEIACGWGSCSVVTAPYDQNGKRQKESNEVLILGDIAPITMEKVNQITLTKEMGGRVILTGKQTEDLFGTQLNIREFDPMCIEEDAKYRDLIKDASEKHGVEEELIASIIIAESSPPWNTESYRYEPGFQIRYIEGTSWVNTDYWIKEGDEGAIKIRNWFSQHPERNDEMSGLTDVQLDLIAQTKLSASYGLMQTMYTTAFESCGYRGEPEGLKDASASIDCGTDYLDSRIDLYTSLPDSVSAYNAGKPRWREYTDNRQYTEKVLGLYNAFKACTA